jgi:hypothetical protein
VDFDDEEEITEVTIAKLEAVRRLAEETSKELDEATERFVVESMPPPRK